MAVDHKENQKQYLLIFSKKEECPVSSDHCTGHSGNPRDYEFITVYTAAETSVWGGSFASTARFETMFERNQIAMSTCTPLKLSTLQEPFHNPQSGSSPEPITRGS